MRLARLQREALRRATERDRAESQRLFFALHGDENKIWRGLPILKGAIKPGDTIYSRAGYRKHQQFFAAGATHRERCFLAANRVGKTLTAGGYETACHLTGLYPEWWPGKRYSHPVSGWAAGKTNETTRDIVQLTLLGEVTFRDGKKVMDGRGCVPGYLLDRPTWKQGVIDLVDTIRVRHASGGWSLLGLKSYEQGRGSFEGSAQHLIWFDEEPPTDVYGEALVRTMTTDGLIMLTFTPLEGMSQVVLSFMPHELRPAV